MAGPSFGGGGARVKKLLAGHGISLTPSDGEGDVEVTATTGGGTVTEVSSPDGTISVSDGTTTPEIDVVAVPSSALVAGTNVTIETTDGKAKVSATGGGGGGVTEVSSPDGSVDVTTGTTTPKLEVRLAKKAVTETDTAATGDVLVYTSTASKWVLTPEKVNLHASTHIRIKISTTAYITVAGSIVIINTTGSVTIKGTSGLTLTVGDLAHVTLESGEYLRLKAQTHTVYFYVYDGDPNTHVDAAAKGAICFDTSTPALWQSTGSGSTDWELVNVGKINTTTITGNPSASGELLVSTASDAAHWTATPPGAKKINTTAVSGNPATAGKVLVSTASDAADWGTPPAPTLTKVTSFITSNVADIKTPKNITSITLGAGTWLVLAQVIFTTSGSGTIEINLSTTTASFTTSIGGAVSTKVSGDYLELEFVCIATPTETTTYYLNGKSGTTITAVANASSITQNVLTGLVAMKL